MKIQAKDTFFKSLKKITNSKLWWHWEFYRTKYYDLKNIIWALRKYFKVVTKMVPWDYYSMILMMHHQAKLLSNYLENHGIEVDESRIPKIKKLNRFIELLDNKIADNNCEKTYAEKCGYDHRAEEIKWVDTENPNLFKLVMEKNKGYEHIDNRKASKDGHKLEEKEWNELMDILKNEMKTWWD